MLYPVGALDVFNYLIEIKLAFHYDANPYLETFKGYRRDSFALPAFLIDTRLFYGPVWLLVSWLPGVVVGYTDVIHSLVAMKVLNAMLLGLTGLTIFRYQGADERRRWLAVYAFLANPLILFEGLANAHNDVLMTCFLVGALVALRASSGLSGALLAASALVKFFTGVLAPCFGGRAASPVELAANRDRGWVDGSDRGAGLRAVLGGREDGDRVEEGTTAVAGDGSRFHLFAGATVERKREVERLNRGQSDAAFASVWWATRKLSPDAKERLQRVFGGVLAVAVSCWY